MSKYSGGIDTTNLIIDNAVAAALDSSEINMLQHFIDNLHERDFFKVEVTSTAKSGLSETGKFFVEKEGTQVDVTDLIAKVSELPINYGSVRLEGTGIDRFLQAIYIMYCDILQEIPDGLSKVGAAQAYEKL